MTPRQRDILDFVRFELTNFGEAPTLQAIGDKFGIGKSNAHAHIEALVRGNHLIKRKCAVRGLSLPDAPDLRTVDSAFLRAELSRRGELLDALARPRPIRNGRHSVTCAVDCCQVPVRPGKLMCWDHWSALPFAMRDDILVSFAARDTERYQQLVHDARELAATKTARGQ